MSRTVGFGPSIVTMIVAVIVILLTIHMFQIAGFNYQKWQKNSQEWCSEQNGELNETVAGGGMSGMKCTLPSGKAVDMGEVAERNYPENASVVPAYGTAPYDGPYSIERLKEAFPEVLILTALLGGFVLSLGVYRRVTS